MKTINKTKKVNLNKAFRELRKLGYIAEQNIGGSLSSGWYEIDLLFEKKGIIKTDNSKAVFYHCQDADDLKEYKSCYLAWSGDVNEIIKVLEANDIDVEWNGSTKQRIKITI